MNRREASRFYWRNIKNIRRFRKTHGCPDHMTPWRWRLLEYRFTWALAKRVCERRGGDGDI